MLALHLLDGKETLRNAIKLALTVTIFCECYARPFNLIETNEKLTNNGHWIEYSEMSKHIITYQLNYIDDTVTNTPAIRKEMNSLNFHKSIVLVYHLRSDW